MRETTQLISVGIYAILEILKEHYILTLAGTTRLHLQQRETELQGPIIIDCRATPGKRLGSPAAYSDYVGRLYPPYILLIRSNIPLQ